MRTVADTLLQILGNKVDLVEILRVYVRRVIVFCVSRSGHIIFQQNGKRVAAFAALGNGETHGKIDLVHAADALKGLGFMKSDKLLKVFFHVFLMRVKQIYAENLLYFTVREEGRENHRDEQALGTVKAPCIKFCSRVSRVAAAEHLMILLQPGEYGGYLYLRERTEQAEIAHPAGDEFFEVAGKILFKCKALGVLVVYVASRDGRLVCAGFVGENHVFFAADIRGHRGGKGDQSRERRVAVEKSLLVELHNGAIKVSLGTVDISGAYPASIADAKAEFL